MNNDSYHLLRVYCVPNTIPSLYTNNLLWISQQPYKADTPCLLSPGDDAYSLHRGTSDEVALNMLSFFQKDLHISFPPLISENVYFLRS